ncbi:GSCFA domain-containing protein [Ideonella sp. DXS29W]|uniref:GSCFA domain-containing protein n=1 Tax=Ideonella lacteola TaxID=2984193 RepID=A0ABU9BPJ2_9BURK
MKNILVEQDGQVRRTSATFYRGETTNFYPTDTSLEAPDAVVKYLTQGWMPPRPFVSKTTPIVAFGSCFATNISNYLHKRGFNVLTRREGSAYVTKMGDGIVNTFAILQQFEWAWLNKVPQGHFWHGYSAEEFGYDEAVRLETRRLFDTADVFIITLGLSEIWYDEPTGAVFWRAVPLDKFDESRHRFRVSTVEENKRNLHEIRRLIRQFRPDAHIVITISPIPLTATFRPVSCVSANAVSKSILRAAVDEVYRETRPTDTKLHYFPSYDMVMYGFDNQWRDDRRHVYPHVLTFNMQVFEAYFCRGKLRVADLAGAYANARKLDLVVAREGHQSSAKVIAANAAAESITPPKPRRLWRRVAGRVAREIKSAWASARK